MTLLSALISSRNALLFIAFFVGVVVHKAYTNNFIIPAERRTAQAALLARIEAQINAQTQTHIAEQLRAALHIEHGSRLRADSISPACRDCERD